MQPEKTTKRLKVTRLKFKAQLAKDLAHLRLKPGDLDLVLAYGRKLDGKNLVLRVFDASQFPTHEHLQKLDGIIVIIMAGEIVAACKTLTDVNQWSTPQDGK